MSNSNPCEGQKRAQSYFSMGLRHSPSDGHWTTNLLKVVKNWPKEAHSYMVDEIDSCAK